MRRAFGAPAPRPGKGLRPLTLFRNDTEQGKPIVSARCAMRTHKVCSFQSIFAYRIAQHSQIILYAQDNPTHVKFPVRGMQTPKKAQRKASFPLRLFGVLPGFSLKIRLAAFAAPHTGLCILFHEFRLLQIQFTAVYGVRLLRHIVCYTTLFCPLLGAGMKSLPAGGLRVFFRRQRSYPQRSIANGRKLADD